MSGRYLQRRLLQLLPTVFGIFVIGFLLVHLAPGDPVLALAGEHGDAAYYAFMRQRFGLDQSLVQQFVTYVHHVATGDLGTSFVYGRSVVDVIAERLPATLLLTGTALVLAVVAAIPLAVLAARRPHGMRDIGISAGVLAMYSAPIFWIGQLAILLLALRLGWLPVQGMTDGNVATSSLAHVADIARHLVLPALVLASHELAVLVRVTRSGLLDELSRHHVRTARGKGVRERDVLLRHALPRALFPVISVLGARTGQLVTGAVVVEVVFGWPGIGRLMLAALQSRDIPIVLGLFMMVTFSVVIVNLVTDLVHAARDERIQIQ